MIAIYNLDLLDMKEKNYNSAVEDTATINYQFITAPLNLLYVCDVYTYKLLLTLMQKESYWKSKDKLSSDGYFYMSIEEIGDTILLSDRSDIRCTIEPLYINGIIDVKCTGVGRGTKKKIANEFKINYDKIIEFDKMPLYDIKEFGIRIEKLKRGTKVTYDKKTRKKVNTNTTQDATQFAFNTECNEARKKVNTKSVQDSVQFVSNVVPIQDTMQNVTQNAMQDATQFALQFATTTIYNIDKEDNINNKNNIYNKDNNIVDNSILNIEKENNIIYNNITKEKDNNKTVEGLIEEPSTDSEINKIVNKMDISNNIIGVESSTGVSDSTNNDNTSIENNDNSIFDKLDKLLSSCSTTREVLLKTASMNDGCYEFYKKFLKENLSTEYNTHRDLIEELNNKRESSMVEDSRDSEDVVESENTSIVEIDNTSMLEEDATQCNDTSTESAFSSEIQNFQYFDEEFVDSSLLEPKKPTMRILPPSDNTIVTFKGKKVRLGDITETPQDEVIELFKTIAI